MFEAFFHSTWIVFSSIGTTLFVCMTYPYPFYNPAKSFYKILDQSTTVVITSTLFIVEYSLFDLCFPVPFLLDEQHSLYQSVSTIFMYSLMIEGGYYLYHRIIHLPYFYKSVHAKHHLHTTVYPLDAFDIEIVDASQLFLCILYPSYLLPITSVEQSVVLYFYLVAIFLSHSSILWSHHIQHHRTSKHNFCLVLPIFDMIFETYR
jgi:sterol desaturase/sphingolipid hydroxylase (fatty acid hydroxylase superfamily)